MTTSTPAQGGRKAEAARNDRTVLNAARAVFFEQGYDAPMSAIAERAGVGMGSLYRRYRSKEDLARRLATVSMEGTLESAERALAEEPDGWSALARFMAESMACGVGTMAQYAGSFPVTSAMVDLSERGHAAMRAILDRAAAEGSLRAGVTPADLVFLLELFRTNTSRRPSLRERHLTVVLDGLRARDTPLPGPAPTWSEVAARWGPAADPATAGDTGADPDDPDGRSRS